MVSTDIFVTVRDIGLYSNKERTVVFHVFKEIVRVFVNDLGVLGCN